MATTLTGLSAETSRLAKQLKKLARQYPEATLEADERIFNRILTHDWRHAVGGIHGPFEARYRDAVAWVESFDAYTKQLREYLIFELEKPERVATLPLTARQRIPSAEIVRLLQVQREMLEKWAEAAKPANSRRNEADDQNQNLREKLQKHSITIGADELAQKIGCSRDTLSDFLRGHTKPQGKTMQKFRAVFKTL